MNRYVVHVEPERGPNQWAPAAHVVVWAATWADAKRLAEARYRQAYTLLPEAPLSLTPGFRAEAS